jgi:hypothetical protein
MNHTPARQPTPLSWADLLAVRPLPTIPPQARSVFLWGPWPVQRVAHVSMARAVASGLAIALIDGNGLFDIAPIVAMAQACRVPPERFLRRIHLVRAFTCWQFATLFCERLAPLLHTETIGLIVLLNPLTHFADQDVTYKEAYFLLTRVLQRLRDLPPHWPRLLLAHTVPPPQTPRRLFGREVLRVVEVGLHLRTDAGRWSVDLVKPRPSSQNSPDRRP